MSGSVHSKGTQPRPGSQLGTLGPDVHKGHPRPSLCVCVCVIHLGPLDYLLFGACGTIKILLLSSSFSSFFAEGFTAPYTAYSPLLVHASGEEVNCQEVSL